MKTNYYMSDEDFEKFLEEIGGLENGYYTDRPAIKERYIASVGNGWLGLIKELIEEAIKLGWDKQTADIKEKFGGLRFYINSASEEVHNRISEAEKLSYKVCEQCGEEGELRADLSWWTTLCDTHYNERKK
jgi:hypothetical protein